MDSQEKYIADHIGHTQPFRVPEGYFDGISSKVMARIPGLGDAYKTSKASTDTLAKGVGATPQDEAPTLTRIVPLRTKAANLLQRHRAVIVSAAASVCIAFFGLGTYFNHESKSGHGNRLGANEGTPAQASYSNMDAAFDYSMMDCEDLYSYMAEAD